MITSEKLTMNGLASKHAGENKRTERALRWLVLLSCSLVSLVALAQWEQSHKTVSIDAHYSAAPANNLHLGSLR